MKKLFSFLSFLALFVYAGAIAHNANAQSRTRINISGTARAAYMRNQARLDFYLKDHGAALGNRVFFRVIRNSNRLELFVADRSGHFRFIRNYRICGTNNRAMPVGIYNISANGLGFGNVSYLRIATNFPNQYDMVHGRSGNLFLQARCGVGQPISLPDPEMDEVFTITYAAMAHGQSNVPIHIFPFEPNAISMFRAQKSPNYRVFRQLEPIYNAFERSKTVPNISVTRAGYSLQNR